MMNMKYKPKTPELHIEQDRAVHLPLSDQSPVSITLRVAWLADLHQVMCFHCVLLLGQFDGRPALCYHNIPTDDELGLL